jgi:Ni/Co efflux regulator RcnB
MLVDWLAAVVSIASVVAITVVATKAINSQADQASEDRELRTTVAAEDRQHQLTIAREDRAQTRRESAYFEIFKSMQSLMKGVEKTKAVLGLSEKTPPIPEDELHALEAHVAVMASPAIRAQVRHWAKDQRLFYLAVSTLNGIQADHRSHREISETWGTDVAGQWMNVEGIRESLRRQLSAIADAMNTELFG